MACHSEGVFPEESPTTTRRGLFVHKKRSLAGGTPLARVTHLSQYTNTPPGIIYALYRSNKISCIEDEN